MISTTNEIWVRGEYTRVSKRLGPFLFIMDACLGHILDSKKRIEMKLDRWQWGEMQCIRAILLPFILLSYLPFFIMFACPGHILESTKNIEMKRCTYIYVKEKVQKIRTIVLSNSLLELPLLNIFHERWFSVSCLGVQVVLDYTLCLL